MIHTFTNKQKWMLRVMRNEDDFCKGQLTQSEYDYLKVMFPRRNNSKSNYNVYSERRRKQLMNMRTKWLEYLKKTDKLYDFLITLDDA